MNYGPYIGFFLKNLWMKDVHDRRKPPFDFNGT